MRIATVAAAVTTALALTLTGCGGGESESDPDSVTVPESLGNCEELAGTLTDDVVGVGVCTIDGEDVVVVISLTKTCSDGRKLAYNDYGWGYFGEEWQDGTPPDGVLSGC